ncbi:acyl-CoA dehydrogenase [Paraburkholderia pallida]|uniref:Acyl-CoA dehydrogenase n=1 Tax=Paraburkholderia pallida TaxID=2547399 RepID=A0A4P7D9P7_9BURK|nr:acyl-CoA dehydrogenase [Paraburkholderia pallida]QBR03970.1 acyl-CoA dehydrogenase [Paraburkholderia pallida]
MSLILSRRDLAFLLYEWLNIEQLTDIPRYVEHSRETFDAALDISEKMATNLFAPHNKKGDQNEPRFDGETVTLIPEVKVALNAFCDAGLMAAEHDYELGGMQFPAVVKNACFAWFQGANVGTSAYPFLTVGNANLLVAHGSAAQIDTFVRPELEGRFFGTMCLSEPQAGSSLSDISTRADYECESPLGKQYRLRGNKMWISGGEHELSDNIVHLVLAKIPDADGKLIPGVKGISLFIVPKYLVNVDGALGEHNDVALAGLNHKMGFRGTTNCLLNFGEGTKYAPGGRAGAIGYLVGEPNRGLAYMFHMMNEARIGVGLGATMLGYTGYLHALDYARNRPQGRPVGAAGKNPSAPQVRLMEHADIRRMLLAQKSYVEGALALNLYCSKLVDEVHASVDSSHREALALLLDLLTPIAKSWPSQWCLAANDLAIQVHGGYGYTREYNVEQFYRDNRLNPIHEGTHGIQGLDLLGRKVVVQNGQALRILNERVQISVSRALDAGDVSLHQQGTTLRETMQRLTDVTQHLWSAGDTCVTLANATVYLEAFGHTVLAWIWLEQALAAHTALKQGNTVDTDFYEGKLAATRYFFVWELPKTGPQFELLASLDTTSLEMRDEWF